jgi:hypothetical protein
MSHSWVKHQCFHYREESIMKILKTLVIIFNTGSLIPLECTNRNHGNGTVIKRTLVFVNNTRTVPGAPKRTQIIHAF